MAVKIQVDKDEWYPVWELDESGRWEVEVADDFPVRFKAALDAFDAVQTELIAAVEKSKVKVT